MKLKLSDYSNIADIVAAVAIVLSLIFVGTQVSDNTQATRSATANAATAITVSAYTAITSSTEASNVWFRGLTDPSSLNDAEKLNLFCQATHSYWPFKTVIFYQKKEHLMSRYRRRLQRTFTG